jgi:hypothetical protein
MVIGIPGIILTIGVGINGVGINGIILTIGVGTTLINIILMSGIGVVEEITFHQDLLNQVD